MDTTAKKWVPEPGGSGVTTPIADRRAMRKSTEDRARTSRSAGRCRVEKQALVEQGSEVGDCHRREGP